MNRTREVVVFGGTGFLGRCIVRHLLRHGFFVRIASRRPERGTPLFPEGAPELRFVRADITERGSAATAVTNAFAVVNAVSLYVERGDLTFRSIHVEAARRLAEVSRKAGVARLAHVSGIGADPHSPSPYIKSRGEGEGAVRASFAEAIIVRPAVMFGAQDAFLAALVRLTRRYPLVPLFGRGRTLLQPAYVDDVAEAIVRALDQPTPAPVYELGGPHILTYRQLLRTIAHHLGKHRLLVPVPFALWRVLARAAEQLPQPPITRNQVELMMCPNVAAPTLPGFACLGIAPQGMAEALKMMGRRDAL